MVVCHIALETAVTTSNNAVQLKVRITKLTSTSSCHRDTLKTRSTMTLSKGTFDLLFTELR